MPNLPTSPLSRSASPEGAVDRLFAQFYGMYGKAWLDMWADGDIPSVKAVWAYSLRHATHEEMRQAIEALEKKGGPFPPSLPEFVSLCIQFKPRGGPANLKLMAPRAEPPADVFRNLRAQLAKGKP